MIVTRGDRASLDRVVERLATTAPTYREIGATQGTLPGGYHHVSEEIELGQGDRVFERAADGIRSWAAHRGAGLAVHPADAPREGATVVVTTRRGPLRFGAACRVVAVFDEPDRFGFAYGTLPGHPESGEESFVVHRRPGGNVVFEVRAFSRPADALARLGGPIGRYAQRVATQRYLRALKSVATAGP